MQKTSTRQPDGFHHPDKPIQASPAALEAPISHGSLADPPKDQSCKAECVNSKKYVGCKNTVGLHAGRDHSHILIPQSFRFISASCFFTQNVKKSLNMKYCFMT